MTWIKYTLQVFKKDQFYLPVALAGLCMILILMIEQQSFNLARSFIGFLLPLIAGGLSAYAFLEDSALELQFTTDRPVWKMIIERLGIVMIIVIFTNIVFQIFLAVVGISLESLGNVYQQQLIWLIPSISMVMLGSAASLITRSSHGGFAVIGTLWITQVIARGWFAQNAIARNVLLFLGAMGAPEEILFWNQVTLMIVSIVLFIVSWYLLKKRERYI